LTYKRLFFAATAVSMFGTGAATQENELVSESINRFVAQCSSAMAEPSAFFESARSQGQGGPVAVARVPDEKIFWVLDMTPPGEVYIHFGEIGQKTRVYCTTGLFNVPEVRDPSATNQAFLAWMDTQDGMDRTGGAVDLKALMAGDEGNTGEQVELTAQIYQHLINGWSGTEAVAEVVIQTGMMEVSAQVILPTSLEIDD